MVNYDGNGQTGRIMMGWRCFSKPLCAVVFRNRFPNICLPPPFTKCLLIRELFVCVEMKNTMGWIINGQLWASCARPHGDLLRRKLFSVAVFKEEGGGAVGEDAQV